MKKLAVWTLGTLFMTGCAKAEQTTTDLSLVKSNFRTEMNRKKTDLYVLRNQSNVKVCIANLSGHTTSMMVPGKDGAMRDVVLGFDSVRDCINKPSDSDAGMGRYASRINQGKFTLDDVGYQLPRNNYGHCLYGGLKGCQYQIYDALQTGSQELELTYRSKNDEEGFPGNITYKVIMRLTDDNAIDIQYEAEIDRPTIVNMINHSYFNLDGDAGSNADYLLAIDADSYAPANSTSMATGEIVTVEGAPIDFHTSTPVGARINDLDFVQLKNDNGYDHSWALNAKGDITRKTATLESPKTGIAPDVYTNELGIQVYVGNFLDGSLAEKKGIAYNQCAPVCLETQKHPDTSDKPEWPSAALRPGEKYNSRCTFKFSADNGK